MKPPKPTIGKRIQWIKMDIEKFLKSLFLKVDEEKVTISLDNENIVINPGFIVTTSEPNENLYFSKQTIIKRGPFKVYINSEHSGGEKIFDVVWRTEKGNDFGFSIAGYNKD